MNADEQHDSETPAEDRSDGGLLRAAALVTVVAVIAAVVLVVMAGRKEEKPQSVIPVSPDPKSLAAAGYIEEDDGRFAPIGFGMTFDYPDGYFEMLSPEGESSRDDETLGIEERRRHHLFADVAKTTSKAADAQPTFRVIRVKYEEPFDGTKLKQFRANLLGEPGDKPSEVKETGGVPAFTRDYEAPGGTGSTTYFAANGMLYQLISFADRDDRRRVERDYESILKSVEFTS